MEEKMHYFEGIVWFKLKKDVGFLNCNEFLSRSISLVMLNDSYLKEIHGNNGFKPYVFSLPYPPDRVNKIYKKNNEYHITVRSIDERFLKMLLFELQNHSGLDFEVKAVKFFKVNQSYIETLHNISPAVLTLKSPKNRHWRVDDGDIMMVRDRIIANLEKKYKHFFGTQLTAPSDAITHFELLNKVPYPIKYKAKTLQSNKFRLGFNSDEVSQKLAFTCMALGMLEKNSLGFGFCVAKTIKALQGLVR
jgi:CRISPR-associated endoribonuclease Cas6